MRKKTTNRKRIGKERCSIRFSLRIVEVRIFLFYHLITKTSRFKQVKNLCSVKYNRNSHE